MARKGQAIFQLEINSDEEWKLLLAKPGLIGIVMQEFQHELACIEGTAKRIVRNLKTLTPEEERKYSEKMRKKLKEENEKKKDVEHQWDKIRHRYYERVARYITNLSVVVFFPHTLEVVEGGKEICPPSNKLMGQYDVARMNIKDQLEVQLTKETIPKIFYNSGVLFPRILLRSLEKQPVIATLLQEFDTKELELKTSSMIRLEAIEHLDEVETRVANLAYGESMNPLDPSPGSFCAEFMFYTPNGTAVPPFWTPREHVSKSAAIEVLFPAIVEELEVKMDPLPPPSYVVIFEARRAREVLDTALQFASNVMHVGFFDSVDPDDTVMVCQTIHQYERLPKIQKLGLKMVLALERTSSDPMLIMASMGPIYISPDTRQGLKEVEAFFPPLVDKVVEPDPWGPPPEDGGVEEEQEEEAEEEVGEELSEEMEDDERFTGVRSSSVRQSRISRRSKGSLTASTIKPEEGDEGPPPSTQASKEDQDKEKEKDKEKDKEKEKEKEKDDQSIHS
ncbi:uncharacterized protein [Halyomorpha halys]|uniref:uncharacterized protein isoform X2 n=1 Tax=Halyomorpha halys TaxID=286706 RepID=UPI0006D4F9A0|nr:uncharacterized protein LOC106677865 isoform X2 [Halyomorpha halys]